MLRKEDWIIGLIIIVGIAAIIFFHVKSSTIEQAFKPPPKIYTTPAPGPEVEIHLRKK